MKRKFLTIGTLALGLLLGCNDNDLNQLNPNQVTTDAFYKNTAELTAGVNSVYAIWQSFGLTAREWWFLHDLRSDDMASGGGQLETPRNQLLNGVHDPANFVMNSVWNGLFRVIHRSNVVIDRSANVRDNETLKKRVVAEAKFLRSLAYFDLVTMWGGVPLYTQEVTAVNGTRPRATEAEIYQLLITDLQAIQADLPATYSGADQGRATRGAAQMLLARVYMQRGNAQQNDYANARTELQKIVNSGTYRLVDEYLDNFLEETEFNPESIFEVGFAKIGDFNWEIDGNDYGANETNARSQEYSPIGWRNLIPSNSLLAEFEHTAKGDAKTDPRLRFNFYFIGDTFNNGRNTLQESQVQGNTSVLNGVTQKISWRKYMAMYRTADTYYTSGINMRLMRYAEALLALAECENEAGNSAAAIALLNQVRTRKSVAMPPYPTRAYPVNSKDEILRAIIHEKRVELAGEEIRNRDILRWRKQSKLRTEPITYFQRNRHELLPIPQSEIDNNDKLEQTDQNPGY